MNIPAIFMIWVSLAWIYWIFYQIQNQCKNTRQGAIRSLVYGPVLIIIIFVYYLFIWAIDFVKKAW